MRAQIPDLSAQISDLRLRSEICDSDLGSESWDLRELGGRGNASPRWVQGCARQGAVGMYPHGGRKGAQGRAPSRTHVRVMSQRSHISDPRSESQISDLSLRSETVHDLCTTCARPAHDLRTTCARPAHDLRRPLPGRCPEISDLSLGSQIRSSDLRSETQI